MEDSQLRFSDLHIHLGASVSPHFLWELAHEQGIRLPEKNYWNFIELVTIRKKTKGSNYLKKLDDEGISPFVLAHRIQSSPYAVEKCTHYVISRAYREFGLSLIELRFNPIFRCSDGLYDMDKIVLSAIIGMQKALIEYPIKAGLILETDRQFSIDKHWAIVKKAVKYKNLGVVGVDVSGPSPKDFKLDSLVEPLKFAKKNGLKVTFHTGEFTDVEELKEVVIKIKPHRIGHGIKAAYDQAAIDLIKKNKVVLEICPTSNIRTSVVKSWEELKFIIRKFLEEEVIFTINSDGPEFLNTNVRKEVEKLLSKEIINFSEAKKIINYGEKYSFL